MNVLIVGASKGLGRAFVEGLCDPGDSIVGISRTMPTDLKPNSGAAIHWIEADMSKSLEAVNIIERQVPERLDTIIYNLGIWEETAFSDNYNFLENSDEELINLVGVNTTSIILL
jgi:short-subunit dehydrogenase